MDRALTRPLYPMILAMAAVLAAYADTHVSVFHLVRPLLLAPAVVGTALAVAGLVTRRWHASALGMVVVMIAVIEVWPALLFLGAGWGVAAWRAMRRQQSPLRATAWMTMPLNVIGVAWLLVASVSAVQVSIPRTVPAVDPVDVTAGVSVYILLLDGYPRVDTLDEYFEFDNQPFLGALARRGFDVARFSQSSYAGTALTLPAMLHLATAEEIGVLPWEDADEGYRIAGSAINGASGIASFENAGYETVSIITSAAPSLDWRNADVTWEPSGPSAFEAHLLGGFLRPLLADSIRAAHRDATLDAFEQFENAAGARRFVFAHVFSPHPPYVFTRDGELAPQLSCEPDCIATERYLSDPKLEYDEVRERMLSQVEYLSARTIAAVDRLIADDPDGIVIVMSDHGSRLRADHGAEWRRNLFASRNLSAPDDIATNDVLPTIFAELERQGGLQPAAHGSQTRAHGIR